MTADVHRPHCREKHRVLAIPGTQAWIRAMAPSPVGTWLWSLMFGRIRDLDPLTEPQLDGRRVT